MQQGKIVVLYKIGEVENPKVRSSSWEEYKIGDFNSKSPPIDYWLKGTLINSIEKDKPIEMNRSNINGIECKGVFISSVVKNIKYPFIYTNNSVYRIDESI
jgi:hypothetical protein